MHRRAEKLADRFNLASTQRMAKGNERGAPTGPLFHYTSVAALEGIVTSETFWFTSVYHMDDDQELSFGFGISHDLLAAALAREDANVIKTIVEDVGFKRIRDRFEFYSASHPVCGSENFSARCERPANGGLFAWATLCRERFSDNPTEIGRYSPSLSQNIPVFRGFGPETGSIALSAGQNDHKFPSLMRSFSSQDAHF